MHKSSRSIKMCCWAGEILGNIIIRYFDNQKALDISSLVLYAKELTLNESTFNDCLNSGRMAPRVQKDLNDGLDYGISGTPTFFINGGRISRCSSHIAPSNRLFDKELYKLLQILRYQTTSLSFSLRHQTAIKVNRSNTLQMSLQAHTVFLSLFVSLHLFPI